MKKVRLKLALMPHFFGLTFLKKTDLFLDECMSICYAYGSFAGFEMAYNIPVPYRKYAIQWYNKRKDEENIQNNKNQPANKPLPKINFDKFVQPKDKSQQNQTPSKDSSSFMSNVRNK